MPLTTAEATQSCTHCGNTVPTHSSSSFCCKGCEAVHRFLMAHDLGNYYEVRRRTGDFRKASPAPVLEDSSTFLFLDQREFRERLHMDPEHPTLRFYLEGIHCAACLWLIEKLPELLPEHVKSARLDLQRSLVTIENLPEGSFQTVANYLESMGYCPHPIAVPEEIRELESKENRKMLYRIGVAGAAAGNIMLFAVSIYAGANHWLKDQFNWICLFLSIPVFFYSARPLYESAWTAVRNKTWSVDIPIVLALWSSFCVSTWSIVHHGHENYLDSLTALIFLLLSSRYLLKRAQSNIFEGAQFGDFYPIQIIRRLPNHTTERVWVKDLNIDDIIEVPEGLRFPVDGIVIEGESTVVAALLTGESVPQKIAVHDSVYSGTLNVDQKLLIQVTAVGSNTRLGKITDHIQSFNPHQHPIVQLADRAGKWFTIVVTALSAVVLFYYGIILSGEWTAGISRVLSVLIVSCPCALAFATPLALVKAYKIALKRGIYLKNPAQLEAFSSIRNIVFDKTGTLTYGSPEVVSVESIQPKYLSIARALEQNSKHPYGKAILRYTERFPTEFMIVDSWNEIPGSGVEGTIGSRHFKLIRNSASVSEATQVTLFEDDKTALCSFYLKDTLRKDAPSALQKVSHFARPWMISGDQYSVVKSTAKDLKIADQNFYSDLSPEGKADLVRTIPKCIFVGDGANDGLALSTADIGIAAHGALDLSLKASSIYLLTNRLHAIPEIFEIAQETHTVLVRNLVLTILYNAAGITFATLGWISPLGAAILMPLSSVTVFITTTIGTKKLRQLWAS